MATDPTPPTPTSPAPANGGEVVALVGQLRPADSELPLPEGWVAADIYWDGEHRDLAYYPARFRVIQARSGTLDQSLRASLGVNGWRHFGTDTNQCELWVLDRAQAGLGAPQSAPPPPGARPRGPVRRLRFRRPGKKGSPVSMNTTTFIGRLTADPELRYTPNGKAVLDARVAVNHHKHDTVFVPIRCWENTATAVAEHLEKGALIGVTGSLSLDEWKDKETGEPRQRLYVTARTVDFLERRLDQVAANGAGAPAPVGGGGAVLTAPVAPAQAPVTDGGRGGLPGAR